MTRQLRQAMRRTTYPLLKVLLRMVLYGVALSVAGGSVYGAAMLLGMPEATSMSLDDLLSGLVLGSLFGGIYGLAYGVLAMPVIGFVMTITAALFFRKQRRPWRLQCTFGAIAAVSIYLASPLNIVQDAFAALLTGQSFNLLADLTVMAITLLAIYCSQIVARKYLRDISHGKRKTECA